MKNSFLLLSVLTLLSLSGCLGKSCSGEGKKSETAQEDSSSDAGEGSQAGDGERDSSVSPDQAEVTSSMAESDDKDGDGPGEREAQAREDQGAKAVEGESASSGGEANYQVSGEGLQEAEALPGDGMAGRSDNSTLGIIEKIKMALGLGKSGTGSTPAAPDIAPQGDKGDVSQRDNGRPNQGERASGDDLASDGSERGDERAQNGSQAKRDGNEPPVFTAEPQINTEGELAPGGAASCQFTAVEYDAGDKLTTKVRWQYSVANDDLWHDVEGAKGHSYVVNEALSGLYLRCVATAVDSAGASVDAYSAEVQVKKI